MWILSSAQRGEVNAARRRGGFESLVLRVGVLRIMVWYRISVSPSRGFLSSSQPAHTRTISKDILRLSLLAIPIRVVQVHVNTVEPCFPEVRDPFLRSGGARTD